jgi:rSAM/selenodomain-associated transferase 2
LVSIIVPVYNEEKNIEGIIRTLESLEGEKEIIVVDGESLDNTFEQASKLSNTIRVKKGRANQMNQGAAAAQGDILWFVHADSKLQKDSIRHIEDAVSEGNVGGGFSIYFYDYNTKFMRYISSTSNRRSILTGLFYGDQGIFVKRKTFFEVGGFPDMELMEDFKFSRIIRKAGKMKLLEKSIGTSARRYKNGGQLRTHLMMHRIRIMYLLGVSPRRLNKIYGESR